MPIETMPRNWPLEAVHKTSINLWALQWMRLRPIMLASHGMPPHVLICTKLRAPQWPLLELSINIEDKEKIMMSEATRQTREALVVVLQATTPIEEPPTWSKGTRGDSSLVASLHTLTPLTGCSLLIQLQRTQTLDTRPRIETIVQPWVKWQMLPQIVTPCWSTEPAP